MKRYRLVTIAGMVFFAFSYAYAAPDCSLHEKFAQLFAPHESHPGIMPLVQDHRIQEAIWLLRDFDAEAATKIETELVAVLERGNIVEIKRLRGTAESSLGKMENSNIEVIVDKTHIPYNIALYVTDRMIGLHAVPVTVSRIQDGNPVSLQYKVKRFSKNREKLPFYRKLMLFFSEPTAPFRDDLNMRFFNWLTGNYDSIDWGDTESIQLTPNKWKIALINPGLAFSYVSNLDPLHEYHGNIVVRINPAQDILAKIHALSKRKWVSQLSPLLSEIELETFLGRIQEIKNSTREF